MKVYFAISRPVDLFFLGIKSFPEAMCSKFTYYVRWGIVPGRFGWVDWQSVGFVQLIIKVIFVNTKFPIVLVLLSVSSAFSLVLFRGNSTPEIIKHDLLEYYFNLSISSFNKSLVFVAMRL